MKFDIPIELLTTATPIQSVDGERLSELLQDESFKLFRNAVDNIKVIRKKYICVSGVSFGKDSTVLLLAALNAHIELMNEGLLDNKSPFVVTHIDTLVENHLLQMLARDQIEQLKAFCEQNNINLDICIGKPALSRQWASLFLSGLKIISSARTNNDCSQILKVDNARIIERSIEKKYKNQVTTLIGSRLDESVARKFKMQSKGTDKVTVESLIDGNEADRVYAPIMEMTDDNVWMLLRMAGSDPIIKSRIHEIVSYTTQHRLLNIIYSDSKGGSCPTTAKKIKGEKLGGCGGSARTGCYVCAKSIHDKSGEAQIKQTRHSVISGNIVKVRNLIMYVAQDLSKRTWHGRAIDNTTNAFALQPNVLNAETIDKLIFLLTQVTWDDIARARNLKKLVSQGRELEDAGYYDIVNDPALAEEDKAVLSSAYLKYAIEPLIQPMSLEIAVYLSAIHSRDGVKLPPFRALHIWHAVSNGARIPYPDVDPAQGKIDEIPDAVMVIPSELPSGQFLGNEILDRETSGGCDSHTSPINSKVSVKDARILIGSENIDAELKGSELISLNSFEASDWFSILRKQPLSRRPKHQFSKRRVIKRRKVGGRSIVVERGRTSLDSPSFGVRSEEPCMNERYLKPVSLFRVSTKHTFDLILNDDEIFTSYDIDYEAMIDWDQFDGAESALARHDEFIELMGKNNKSIYKYGGIGAFEHLLRWGVFKMNSRARQHTLRILERTNYFNTIGLYSLNDDEIRAMALGENVHIDTSALRIKEVMPMSKYRMAKAEVLLTIRAARNASRKMLKARIKDFSTDINKAAKQQLIDMFESAKSAYIEAVRREYQSLSLICNNITSFDGSNYHVIHTLSCGSQRYIESFFDGVAGLKKSFNNKYIDDLKSNKAGYEALTEFNYELLRQLKCNVRQEALQIHQSNHGANLITTKEEMLLFR